MATQGISFRCLHLGNRRHLQGLSGSIWPSSIPHKTTHWSTWLKQDRSGSGTFPQALGTVVVESLPLPPHSRGNPWTNLAGGAGGNGACARREGYWSGKGKGGSLLCFVDSKSPAAAAVVQCLLGGWGEIREKMGCSHPCSAGGISLIPILNAQICP